MNKKIFIVILVIVLLLALCIGIILILNANKIEQASNENIEEDSAEILTDEKENVEAEKSNLENVIIKENTTIENSTSNSLKNNVISNDNVTTNTFKASSNTTTSKNTNTTSDKTTSATSKDSTSGTSTNNNSSSNNKNSTSSTTKNNTLTNEVQTNTNTHTNIEEKEPDVEVVEVIETYKVNNDIINKMKSVIENNKSSYMQEYGYNVVIDSSIVNETNQFTFTENRVKNYILNRFGTIKIYARDYYCNGEYVWTESFIL